MSSVSVSVVVIGRAREAARIAVAEAIRYFDGTGLTYEVILLDPDVTDHDTSLTALPPAVQAIAGRPGEPGGLIRNGVQESRGEVIALIDGAASIRWEGVGDAVAMLQSTSADCAIGYLPSSSTMWLDDSATLVTRMFLSPEYRRRSVLFMFSAMTARRLFSESKVKGEGVELEVLFLANKYGFRVEAIALEPGEGPAFSPSPMLSLERIAAVPRVRLLNRRMLYRPAQRCPVCFSAEVWSSHQTESHVVRGCRRCKCSYLMPSEIEGATGREALSAPARLARQRNTRRRAGVLERTIPSLARILDAGAQDADLGLLLKGRFDYVALEWEREELARAVRARGVECYHGELEAFVNVGAPFDVVTFFHSFGRRADPHAALARVKDLMKPGGVLLIVAADTESLTWSMAGVPALCRRFPGDLIFYSHSSLIELLEHSGFEIVNAVSDWEFQPAADLASGAMPIASLARPFRKLIPSLTSLVVQLPSGAIRIVAKRRAGSPLNLRSIRAAEPTHAR